MPCLEQKLAKTHYVYLHITVLMTQLWWKENKYHIFPRDIRSVDRRFLNLYSQPNIHVVRLDIIISSWTQSGKIQVETIQMPCQTLLYIAEHWFCRGLKRAFLNMWSKLQSMEGFPWGAALTPSTPLMLPTQLAVGVSSGKSLQMFLHKGARGSTTVL